MHWHMGELEIARRAGVTAFSLSSKQQYSTPSMKQPQKAQIHESYQSKQYNDSGVETQTTPEHENHHKARAEFCFFSRAFGIPYRYPQCRAGRIEAAGKRRLSGAASRQTTRVLSTVESLTFWEIMHVTFRLL